MQIKTISKNIKNKLEEWLNSITDEQLKKDLMKNVLVSGGSITSMLLNENVNDYDVYIKDRAVLVRLVSYYVKPFESELTILLGENRQNYIDEILVQYEPKKLEEIPTAYTSAVRNLHDDQVKIFINKKDGGLRVNEDIPEDKWNYTPMFFSPNAISLSNQIQIVIRFYGDNEQIHKTFDFIHATNYFTFEDGLVTNKEALESIITKQLRYQGGMYPLTSIIRMKKFVKRGWNINAGELLKIMFQISDLDLHNPDVLEEQLIGVDIAYFSLLIEAIREVDASKLTSAYLNVIIDRIFNNFEEIDE